MKLYILKGQGNDKQKIEHDYSVKVTWGSGVGYKKNA